MASYVRVVNNVVLETGTFADQAEIDSSFESGLAAEWEIDTAGTAQEGWDKNGADDFAAPSAYTPDVEDIRTECRRRIKLDGHDLLAKKATPPSASTTYLDDCVTACETLEGTLPADYLTSSEWPALP